MNRNINTKFYTVNQNNSGGYFIKNDDVDTYVIVEAVDCSHAQQIFDDILDSYREYCSCCGSRWNDDWLDENDGHDIPSIYSKDFRQHECSPFDDKVIVYYLDGTKLIRDIKTGEESIIK